MRTGHDDDLRSSSAVAAWRRPRCRQCTRSGPLRNRFARWPNPFDFTWRRLDREALGPPIEARRRIGAKRNPSLDLKRWRVTPSAPTRPTNLNRGYALRVHWAPGIPHALCFQGERLPDIARVQYVGRERGCACARVGKADGARVGGVLTIPRKRWARREMRPSHPTNRRRIFRSPRRLIFAPRAVSSHINHDHDRSTMSFITSIGLTPFGKHERRGEGHFDLRPLSARGHFALPLTRNSLSQISTSRRERAGRGEETA